MHAPKLKLSTFPHSTTPGCHQLRPFCLTPSHPVPKKGLLQNDPWQNFERLSLGPQTQVVPKKQKPNPIHFFFASPQFKKKNAHTCLMDTCIHVNPVSAVFAQAALVNTNSKAMGRKQVLFQKDLCTWNSLKKWVEQNWKLRLMISRYVFTPMLSGLRWPGQTVIGSWPPALWNRVWHTNTHGLHGVITLEATGPLENRALKGRVEKGGRPWMLQKGQAISGASVEPSRTRKRKRKSQKGWRPQAWGEMAQ